MIVSGERALPVSVSVSVSASVCVLSVAHSTPPDILKSNLHRSRDRSMSLDFPPPQSQHLYSQQDLDHPFSDLSTPSHQHPPSHLPLSGHALDRNDPMDVSDHSSYDIFSSSAQSSSLPTQRYRGNSSAASNMPSSYGLGVDSMYSQSPFSESLQHFHNPSPNPYDPMGGLSSSYSSGKPSPLTPNDSGSLQHSSAFPFNNGQSKDYHSGNGFNTDVLDRRMSGLSTGNYMSDYPEDYNNMNSFGLGLPAYDRLGRMQQESRYGSSVIPPLSIPPHLHPNHPPDLMPGVNPVAMQYREGGDLPPFIPSGPRDFGMSGMDGLGVRINGGGAPTDLQTFIRYVSPADCFTTRSLSGSAPISQTISGPVCPHTEPTRIWRANGHRNVQQGRTKILRHGEAVRITDLSTLTLRRGGRYPDMFFDLRAQISLSAAHCDHDWQLVVVGCHAPRRRTQTLSATRRRLHLWRAGATGGLD